MQETHGNASAANTCIKLEFTCAALFFLVVTHSLVPFLSFYLSSPWRILEDAGGAFAMGSIGGGIWHFVKGFRNSPRVSRVSLSISISISISICMRLCLCKHLYSALIQGISSFHART